MVAGKHQHVFRVISLDELDILVYRICSSAIPVGGFLTLIRRQDLHTSEGAVKVPRQTVSDVVVEQERLILGKHPHGINARINAVGEGKVDDAVFAAEGYGGLGELGGQRVKSAALTAGEQHGNTFFLSVHTLYFPFLCFQYFYSCITVHKLYLIFKPIFQKFLMQKNYFSASDSLRPASFSPVSAVSVPPSSSGSL